MNPQPSIQTGPVPLPDSLLTRQSLLTRLKDWDDHAGWREFFDTYWRLIYSVARKAGLADADAQDLVQEVLLGVARQMPAGTYDKSRGRFKHWLLGIVRHRLADYWKKQGRAQSRSGPMPERESLLGCEDPELDRMWQKEWTTHLLQAAMARVQSKVSARNFLIFDLSMVRQTPTSRISQMLGVSTPHIWIVRHRVGKLVAAEVRRLEAGL
jgi:RNA polymerase sigma factor (sigma-70 family)